ncbi:hypothetical protein CR513_43373, partial [Mucuna pruriens]
MEFRDNLVQFNIFEAMKHPNEDHSLFSIDVLDELVEEYMQIGTGSADFANFVEIANVIDCFNSVEAISNSVNMSHIQDFSDFEDNIANLADLVNIFEFSNLTDLVCMCDGDLECLRYANLRIADTSKPRVTQVAAIAIDLTFLNTRITKIVFPFETLGELTTPRWSRTPQPQGHFLMLE